MFVELRAACSRDRGCISLWDFGEADWCVLVLDLNNKHWGDWVPAPGIVGSSTSIECPHIGQSSEQAVEEA